MKTKCKMSIYAVIVMAIIAMITVSCEEKDNDPEIPIPVITTSAVTDITQTAANCGGDILDSVGEHFERGVCWNTLPNPTIANSKSSDYTGLNEFYSTMLFLNPGTDYYVRAYATNTTGTGYGNEVMFRTVEPSPVTTTDIDGNVYHVVTIGTQDWLVENLRVTHYRNGDPIPIITSSAGWSANLEDACCNYKYDDDTAGIIYGRLYNWEAVSDSRNIAPEGFHVPTDAEWQILTNYTEGLNFASGKLKENGTTHWRYINAGATNETGFSALPGGWCDGSGGFQGNDDVGFFYTATEADAYGAWVFYMVANADFGYRLPLAKINLYSVRCVRD